MNKAKELLTKREHKKQKREQFIAEAIGWTLIGIGGVLTAWVWYVIVVAIFGGDA